MRRLLVSVVTLAAGLGAVEARAQTCSCPLFSGLVATQTTTNAVSGTATGAGGTGVYGVNTSSSASAVEYGVQGIATNSTAGVGVYGTAGAFGVEGDVAGAGGSGVVGWVPSNQIGTGVTGSNGVDEIGSAGDGVYGVTAVATAYGVEGANNTTGLGSAGVYGHANGGSGVSGTSVSGAGVQGESGSYNGVVGASNAYGASGVYGYNTGQGYGVAGRTVGVGNAIYGDNTNSSGWSGNFTGWVNVATCLKVNGTPYGNCSSDARLKKNIQPLVGSLDKILRLRPVTFEWKEPDDHNGPGTQIGFIAQDVEKVLPEWVGANDKGFKTVDKKGLDVMLVASVQALKRENDGLRARVNSLEAGRRPMISGVGEGGIGLGLVAIAGALVITHRKRSDERA